MVLRGRGFKGNIQNLESFLSPQTKKLEILFQKKQEGIDLKKNCLSFDNHDPSQEFNGPKGSSILENDLKENPDQTLNYYETLVAIESIHSLYKVIKRLIHFKEKIDLAFQSAFISDTIDQYKVIITESCNFILSKMISKLINMEKINEKILESKWDPNESEAETQLFEESPFVSDTIKEFNRVKNKGPKLRKFSVKVQSKFIDFCIEYIVDNIMDCFSKIKRCNATGRSIMLKDLKFGKQKIEDLVNKQWGYSSKTEKYFNSIFNYVNSWYYNTDEMFEFLFDNNIGFKFWQGIANTSPVYNDLSMWQRRDFRQKVEDEYYKQYEKCINLLENQ